MGCGMANGEHAERISVTESEIDDLRADICRLETKQAAAAESASDAHDVLIDKVHAVDIAVTKNAVTMRAWGSVLAGLIAVFGVAAPVIIALVTS